MIHLPSVRKHSQYIIIALCAAASTGASARTPASVAPWEWTSEQSAPGGYSPDSLMKETCVYAIKDGDSLKLDVYYNPTAEWRYGAKRPVIIFSFGGGWEAGARADGPGTIVPSPSSLPSYR